MFEVCSPAWGGERMKKIRIWRKGLHKIILRLCYFSTWLLSLPLTAWRRGGTGKKEGFNKNEGCGIELEGRRQWHCPRGRGGAARTGRGKGGWRLNLTFTLQGRPPPTQTGSPDGSSRGQSKAALAEQGSAGRAARVALRRRGNGGDEERK